jgi:hypothetical protein
MKPCSRCFEEKSLSEFDKNPKHSSGYKSQCKVCSAKDFKAWRESNLEKQRRRERVKHYVRKYALSFEEAEELVETNRLGICEICKEPSQIVIDHCHQSGIVRGRICSACNSMLGYSKDNIGTLKSAIKYLESFYGES